MAFLWGQTYTMPPTWFIPLLVPKIAMNYMLLCLTTKSKMAPCASVCGQSSIPSQLLQIKEHYSWMCSMIACGSRKLSWSVFRSQKWPAWKNTFPGLLSKQSKWLYVNYSALSITAIPRLRACIIGYWWRFLHYLVKKVSHGLFNELPSRLTVK